jgi:hypothetical protein
MIRRIKIFKLSITAIMLVGFMAVTLNGREADFKPVAEEYISSSGISWTPKVNYARLVLTISRPDGSVFRKTIESRTTPYANISEIFGEAYADGFYTYELRVIPALKNREGNNRNALSSVNSQTKLNRKALIQSGSILIRDGGIVTKELVEVQNGQSGVITAGNGSLSMQNRLAGTQDQQILDDLIVDGSACIGQDCVNNESFGFDTLRLKENNLRIKFQDTSNSGSFPSNDWQLTANDSSNGGANKFSIDDIDGGKTPFTIEAGAPTNSLFVDDGGRVGFGTATPVVDLHTVSGNTPTLRLEQDSSSGFTAQTWDVAGNETNFFIRDATNGSKLPFKIKPGAPNNALYIDADGDVGFGTTSPDFTFEVEESGSKATVAATRSDGTPVTVEMSATNVAALIGTTTDHPMRFRVNSNLIMEVFGTSATNYIEMYGGGTYDGNWNDASSRELKDNIRALSSNEAMDALEGLSPVKYHYKRNKNEEHVGFIAEDVPELVATNSRKNLSSMDIVAVLTQVVKEQQKSISRLEQKLAEIEKKKK